jgi:dTDP-4-amino-4,6-dideoxygalactose transaminase
MSSPTVTTAIVRRPLTPKSHWRQFALFGGEPAFSDPLHVGSPNLPDEASYLERVRSILRSHRLTNDGPTVQQFEEEVRCRLGVRHAIAVSNATTGLQLLFHALELKGAAVMPSFTFVATAHAARWVGLRPRFADIELTTCHVSPGSVESALERGASAIVGVHLWGGTADIGALSLLSEQRQTPLIFDASHGLGCEWRNVGIGRFGTASVFSLHATKIVHSLEGGIITTEDDDLAKRLKHMRNFGFSTYDTVECLGTNAKMHELSAAMGLEMLSQLDTIIEHNHRVFQVYSEHLSSVPGLRVVVPQPDVTSNWQYVPVFVDAKVTGIDRDTLLELLWADNVRARRYFYPGCHRMPPYDRESEPNTPLSNTEIACQQLLTLPTGTSVDLESARVIAQMIAFACENAESIPSADRIAA